MQTVTSMDGTAIAYDTTGKGPCLIVVNGALSYRKSAGIDQLVNLLAKHFTVISYDICFDVLIAGINYCFSSHGAHGACTEYTE